MLRQNIEKTNAESRHVVKVWMMYNMMYVYVSVFSQRIG